VRGMLETAMCVRAARQNDDETCMKHASNAALCFTPRAVSRLAEGLQPTALPRCQGAGFALVMNAFSVLRRKGWCVGAARTLATGLLGNYTPGAASRKISLLVTDSYLDPLRPRGYVCYLNLALIPYGRPADLMDGGQGERQVDSVNGRQGEF